MYTQFYQGLEEISNIHANILINVGDSTSRGMLNLIAFVKQKVDQKFGYLK